jgi:hypothetical protein
MLSRCLNSACGASFRYLSEGRIFHIERVMSRPGNSEPQRIVEPYWLCRPCSLRLKVVVENGEVTTQSIELEPANPEIRNGHLSA